jgi:hypothetical protein
VYIASCGAGEELHAESAIRALRKVWLCVGDSGKDEGKEEAKAEGTGTVITLMIEDPEPGNTDKRSQSRFRVNTFSLECGPNTSRTFYMGSNSNTNTCAPKVASDNQAVQDKEQMHVETLLLTVYKGPLGRDISEGLVKFAPPKICMSTSSAETDTDNHEGIICTLTQEQIDADYKLVRGFQPHEDWTFYLYSRKT